MPIPVVVNVYNDRSFDFVCKSPPAAALLKQAAGIAKGSGVPNKEKVGKVNKEQLDKIVKLKTADLNACDPDHARRMIEGTARSMGIDSRRLNERNMIAINRKRLLRIANIASHQPLSQTSDKSGAPMVKVAKRMKAMVEKLPKTDAAAAGR